MKRKIIVACGGAVATSTMAAGMTSENIGHPCKIVRILFCNASIPTPEIKGMP